MLLTLSSTTSIKADFYNVFIQIVFVVYSVSHCRGKTMVFLFPNENNKALGSGYSGEHMSFPM